MSQINKTYKKVIRLFQTNAVAKTTCSACFRGELQNAGGQFLTNTGCCGSCSKSGGYLAHHYTTEDIERIRRDYEFDANKGFLGPNGCKLPYSVRSGVCIGYTCWNLYKALVVDNIPESTLNDTHRVWVDQTKRIYESK